jgi:hypothetical protein
MSSSNDKVHLSIFFEKMLALEDQILCKEFENEAGEKYDKMITSFSVFQGHLRDLTMDIKQ